MSQLDFAEAFRVLTESPAPFPWQVALYERFLAGDIPASCNLPTGLGKTSVIAIWLIALANAARVPRRLVYVVNRRTVVDQTTNEVEKYRENLRKAGLFEILEQFSATKLADEKDSPLAISTLRGQFADNREWSVDPSRPAVICGTVDMIGSRLLFSGYGLGFKSRPLHAGFLGQDALLVHDEAHLEPAFQTLVESIQTEQARCKEFETFRVMELTATSRGSGSVFTLTDEDRNDDEVKKRIGASKAIHLHENRDEKKLADEIAELALQHKDSGKAVLVFVRKVDDVEKIVAKLRKEKLPVQQLTGTLRGLERDRMADPREPEGCPIFARFLNPPKLDTPENDRWKVTPTQGTVYLVCTSAGEVGVNISADHLVCDLSTFDSMAQRFGRVNRFGICTDTRIDIVVPTKFDEKDYDARRKKTLALLRSLNGNGSPARLDGLDPEARKKAFSPPPVILPVTDILFDAWALTTIKGRLPGRPIVEPYLHGLSEWQPPETHVAWRDEVAIITTDQLRDLYHPADLLEDYPLKPHELLRDDSKRVFDRLSKLKAEESTPVWIVSDDDSVEVTTLGELIAAGKEDIERKTILLPPAAGGLESGMLTSNSTVADNVADAIFVDDERKQLLRVRVDDPVDERAKNMRLIRRIDFPSPDGDDEAEGKSWYWFGFRNDGEKTARLPVLWRVHVDDVIGHARSMVAKLPLDQNHKDAIIVAAQLHDHGKKRRQFQRVLNNLEYPEIVLAKSGKKGGRVPETYRHEFGSLLELGFQAEFQGLTDSDIKELVLHLVAAHHGRGRPHFPQEEAFDPEPPPGSDSARVAVEVPQRFARLQRKYGRWGLAYLESLLRAADWAASAKPSAFVEENR